MKKTAVEWLETRAEEREKNNPNESAYWHLRELIKDFEQAKEMEKEQHFNTWWHGISEYEPILFEQYYNETYGGNNHLCCTPIGQIKRYVNCIGCDRKPLTYGGKNEI
jgi:hypothetical protein